MLKMIRSLLKSKRYFLVVYSCNANGVKEVCNMCLWTEGDYFTSSQIEDSALKDNEFRVVILNVIELNMKDYMKLNGMKK